MRLNKKKIIILFLLLMLLGCKNKEECDKYRPIIELKGESIKIITKDSIFIDQGANAYDNIDGDISSNIITTGLPLDTNTEGIYRITYDVRDSSGNSANRKIRLIRIINSIEKTKKISILLLGNSITKHGPRPEIGWYGNYGMAASSEKNDYVHVLIDKLNKLYLDIDYKVENISFWEKDFFYNLEQYKEIENYNPDIIIVRLGENVDAKYAKKNNYRANLEKMMNYYKKENTVGIIITNTCWGMKYIDYENKYVALKNGFGFSDISILTEDKKYFAYNEYENDSVRVHPSDIGMKEIAESIYNTILESDWNIKLVNQ